MKNFNEKIENIFDEEKIKNSFWVEYGVIDNKDIDDFYNLIKQDFKWWENDNKLDLDKIEEFISKKYWSPKQTSYFNALMPEILNKFTLDQEIKLESKILLEKEIKELKEFITWNKKIENRSWNDLSYYAINDVELEKEVSWKEKLSNRKLTEEILPKRFTENNSFFEINFDILKAKTTESFSRLLQEIFNNLSEKELYILNWIIAWIQANWFWLNSKILNLWLKDFLNKKFPKYLQEAKLLSESNLEKDKNLLKWKNYWIIRNLLQLTEMSWKIESKTWKEKLNIWTFSPGGSYWPIYLWQLHKQYKENTLPDLYIWASAGSLYPTLFLLWKKALEKDKNLVEKLTWIKWDSLESLVSLIPKELNNSSSMLLDWEELINSFFNVFKKLVKIISPNKNMDFENLTFNDLDLPIIAVSSYEYQNENYVPWLFTNNDNIKKSIITSSNPEINILWFDMNVLTNDNEIYWNDWNDWDHSLTNPIEMAYLLNYNKINRYESFNTWEKDIVYYKWSSEDIKDLAPLKNIRLDVTSQWNGFDLDNAKFLSIVWNVWEISIYDLYDLLSWIKNSSITDKNKTYYRNKLIKFLLKKDIISISSKKEKNDINKIKNLLNSNLTTKEENTEIVNHLVNSKYDDILQISEGLNWLISQTKRIQKLLINKKKNFISLSEVEKTTLVEKQKIKLNKWFESVKKHSLKQDKLFIKFIDQISIDLSNNKEFYILFKNNSKIKELIQTVKKVFMDIETNYKTDDKVVLNAKKWVLKIEELWF